MGDIMYEVRRRAIFEVLKYMNDLETPVLFSLPKEELNKLFFEKVYGLNKEIYYVFAETLMEVKDKIDFSNVSFDGINIKNMDFTNMYGVKINPQTIYEKNLYKTILNGVEFVSANKAVADLFDGVDVRCANFTGSKGARINPQTIKEKSLFGSVLCDVDFTGFSFEDVHVGDSNFTGSKGAKIDPNHIFMNKSVNWNNVEFIDIPVKRYEIKYRFLVGTPDISLDNLYGSIDACKEEVLSYIKINK